MIFFYFQLNSGYHDLDKKDKQKISVRKIYGHIFMMPVLVRFKCQLDTA